jgi:UDP-N-acetyl-D-glucosamine dehydrogenase
MDARTHERLDARTDAQRLAQRLAEHRAKLGVIGLGYVGLPLALTAATAGYAVLGFDIDQSKIEKIGRGESFFNHISGDIVAEVVSKGRFQVTTDFGRLDEPDVVVICVPTPLTRNREPDLSFVENTARAIARRLRRGQLIVLESTTYPGTTTEVVKPILETSGLGSGIDFFLAFSPEREDPGNVEFGTARIPKVVGGDGADALALADTLYSKLVAKTVPVSSPATAEAVKLTENIFRAVNIALVNELKVIYAAMGIDVWEVIEAAKTKPFGFMAFYPGPGLGGHCIPIDPFYLTWKAREYDIATRFIELAGEINTRMPLYVVDRIIEALDRNSGKGLSSAKVLILGVTYKKNIDDIRESPALKLIELLENRGAKVDYFDPFKPVLPVTREHAALAGRRSVTLTSKTVSAYDAVVIATDHDNIDYRMIVANTQVIVDTRNACAKAGVVDDRVIKA